MSCDGVGKCNRCDKPVDDHCHDPYGRPVCSIGPKPEVPEYPSLDDDDDPQERVEA